MSRISFFLFVIFLISINLSFGQQAAPGIDAITPTTPEAGTLSRAGNVPINTATGQMSYSVPIHNIAVNGNSWPVSLSYNYGGFIAEAKPSLTGWGWNLNAYGSITKVVRGLPDFHPDGYYGENNRKEFIDQYVATNNVDAMPFNHYYKFITNEYDSEADKYIVNIGGANFGFKVYIDEPSGEYKAYFLSNHNYKVEIIMQQHPTFEIGSFVVTDDQGIKYYFDGDDRERVIPSEDPGHPYLVDKTTSWLLSKIKYLNGEEIEFSYVAEDYFSWDFSASVLVQEGATTSAHNQEGYVDGVVIGYEDNMNQTYMERKLLNTIRFPKGSLTFGTTTGPSGHTVFDSIILADSQGIVVCDYEIDYNGSRDALAEIRKNDELLFGFEYSQLNFGNIPGFYESPTNRPHSQDLWGFYNGANNTEAIDHSYNGQVNKSIHSGNTRKGAMNKINYPTGGSTVIDYEQNSVKVNYGNSIYGGAQNENIFNEEIYLSLDLDADVPNNEKHTEITQTFGYPVRVNLSHSIIGNVASGNAIYVGIEALDGVDISQYNSCYTGTPSYNGMRYPLNVQTARDRLLPPDDDPDTIDLCENFYPNPIVIPAFIIGKDVDNNCAYWGVDGATNDWYGCTGQDTINQQFNSTPFWIPAGTYRFVISTHVDGDPNRTSSFTQGELFASLRLQYYIPEGADEQSDPENLFVNDPIGGIRVSSIRNFDGTNGDPASTINYSYNDDEGLSTGHKNQTPSNREVHNINIFLEDGTNFSRVDTHFKLNSFGAMDAHNGIPVYYNRVRKYYNEIITTDEDNQNPPIGPIGPTLPDEEIPSQLAGGVEVFEYLMPAEDRNYKYPARPIHIDKSQAKLAFSKMESQNEIVSFEENGYLQLRHTLATDTEDFRDMNPNHPWSFKIVPKKNRSIYAHYCYELGNSICHEAIRELYKVIRYKEVESHFEVSERRSMLDGIEKSQSFMRQGDNINFVTEQITTTSDDDIIRQVFEYPIDRLEESQYQSMVNRNQIAQPVVERTYLNDRLIGSQKTDFIFNINGYHPNMVKGSKGDVLINDLETIYTIESYDEKGNITQVKKRDGITTSYLWGYDKQYPIAQVTGSTFSEALLALSGTTYAGLQSLDEEALKNALQTIRDNLPKARMTSYTYDPLIGMTSQTDPRGYTMYYEYDSQNRLQYVKDSQGNILSENEYNYRTNN